MDHYKNGVIWMLVHVFASSLFNVFFKTLLGSYGFTELQLLLIIYVTALIIMIPYGVVFAQKIVLKSLKLHILRALILVTSHLLMVYSYDVMPFPQVAALTTTYPVLSTMMAVFFLKERLSRARVVALILGFIGSLIIINPSIDMDMNFIYVIVAVCLWGIFDVIAKIIYFKNEEQNEIMYFFTFSSIFLFLAQMFFGDSSFPEIDIVSKIFSVFLPLGAILIIYMFSFLYSIKGVEIGKVVPLYFLNMLLAILFGYLIFGEVISMNAVIGSMIVLFGTFYMIFRERNSMIDIYEEYKDDGF